MHPCQKDFEQCNSLLTDKISHHGYHRFYPFLLREFRHRPVRLLEIGLAELGSVQLWQAYFKNGIALHGIDLNKKESSDANVRFHQADQGDADQLRRLRDSIDSDFDIIIDDGSHVPAHQSLTLNILWSKLVPGGVYIIEDIETSYWGASAVYGYKFDARRPQENIITQLLPVIDAVNSEFLSHAKRDVIVRHPLGAVLMDVEMVSFGHNCIILVKKDGQSFSHLYDRDYRLADQVMGQYGEDSFMRRIYREGLGGFVRGTMGRLFGRRGHNRGI